MKKIGNGFGLERICPFLWGDDSPEAQHGAAQWMYANHAATAYAGFLKQGRGVLAGPFATTADGAILDCGSFKAALFETGEMWTASVSYFPVTQQESGIALFPPETRNLLVPALGRYDPELEVPILLMRNGRPHVFLSGFSSEASSPRYLYELAAKGPRSLRNILLPVFDQARPSNWTREADKFQPILVPPAVSEFADRA